MIPSIAIVAFADRPVPDDTVTFYGTAGAVGVVGLVLTFLVSMGFLLGTLLRNQLLAIVVLAFLWFPVNLILNLFSLEEFSPISLNQALPTLLRQPWTEVDVESKEASFQEAARQAAEFFSGFGGAPDKPAELPGFFEREGFDDFSLWRVLMGYGIPTLAALALAMMTFCLRDL
jgi:ABC-type transport system involved in multi-copper enzyme maturation permease subunit